MIVVTENSTYILEDKGDGAFRVTSNNPKYRGPLNMVQARPIRVNDGLVLRYLSGPKKGRYLVTSRIISVQED